MHFVYLHMCVSHWEDFDVYVDDESHTTGSTIYNVPLFYYKLYSKNKVEAEM